MAVADVSNSSFGEIVSLKGRRAVVAGGAHGMGASIARRLAEAGASVIIGDLDHAAAKKTAQAINYPVGGVTEALDMDAASEESIIDFADAAAARMGGIDIWVSNVGYYPHVLTLEMDTSAWDKVQALNLRSTFIGAREAARRMIACGSVHAVIVNIASMAGLRARTQMSHYVAAKHGVVGLTKALALELGPKNIRVLGIAPALIVTPTRTATKPEALNKMSADFPVGRYGVPDDIARVALFCASDLSAFMSGSTLMVDGGSGAGVFP